MTPAVRKSALGIKFTKQQLKELRAVWNDEAWDDVNRDFENTQDEDRFCYDNGIDWEVEEDDEEDEDDEEEGEEGDETKDKNEIEDESVKDCFTDQANNDKDEDKDSENFHGSEEQYTPAPKINKLAELAFRLSVFLATEPFTDRQPSSSLLVYYSGVLGCTEDGLTFRRPKDYTPQLSVLIYIQRLLLLEFALSYKAYTYVCLPCRSRYGQLERLNEVRLETMVFGCLTPLGEFISLRSRRRKLARADPPSFLARWSDDGQTFYYNDTSISMVNFRTFGHSLVDRAKALCRSLMFGWFPNVNLSQVKDDMSNTLRGYSFF
ncbi:hypothetical protein DL98DRAFT_613859 [Cadophora sp. DSE1049]|nr:hypothetical protein DL98DRAFT_613859 [Cadophora sp. DSE1049]